MFPVLPWKGCRAGLRDGGLLHVFIGLGNFNLVSSAEKGGVGEAAMPGREKPERGINLSISSTQVSLVAASRSQMCVRVYSKGLRLLG